MAGLLDLAPSTRKVHGVTVTGISAAGLVSIVQRFPALGSLIGGMGAKGLDAPALLGLAPEAVKAIIAAGVGFPGDEAQETAAGNISLERQADFLEAIIAETLPSGFGPFVARIQALGSAAESFNGGSTATLPNGQTAKGKGRTEDPYTKLRQQLPKSKRGESRKLAPGK
jgi:hypothetical protein